MTHYARDWSSWGLNQRGIDDFRQSLSVKTEVSGGIMKMEPQIVWSRSRNFSVS